MLRAQPFRPFILHMGGGRSAKISHPERAALHPAWRVVVVFGPGGEMEIIDMLKIQSIEVLTNGKGKGRGRRRAG